MTKTSASFLLTLAMTAPPAVAGDAAGWLAVAPAASLEAGQRATLYAVARGPSGAPLDDLKLSATLSAGRLVRTTALGQGLYAVEIAVPRGAEPLSIEISGRTRSKETLATSATLPVVWGPADNYELSAAPGRLVLGKDATTTVQLGVKGEGGVDLNNLSVRTIHGNAGGWALTDPRVASGTYTPDAVSFPHIDIVIAQDPTAPSVFGWTGIALAGQVAFPVTSAPNAQVSIRVAGNTYGPVPTDAQGAARVPIVVEPGVSNAELLTTVAGKTTATPLDLKVPATQRLLFAPPPSAILADPDRPRSLFLAVLQPDGRPDTKAAPKLTASGGTLGELKPLGAGLYEVELTPPATPGETITVSASLDGEAKQHDEVQVPLVDAIPSRVALRTVPDTVTPTDPTAALYVYVQGAGAATATAEQLTVGADGAQAAGAVAKADAGIFAAQFTLDGRATGPRFFADYHGASAGEGPVSLALRAREGAVLNDGADEAALQIGAFDALGRPVAGAKVTLELVSGGGRLPATATTDANGTAEVRYRSGAPVGLVGVRASLGDLSAATALVQGPLGSAPVALPASGGPAAERAMMAFETLHPALDFSGVAVVEVQETASKPAKEKPAKGEKPAKEPKGAKEPSTGSSSDESPLVVRALASGGLYSFRQQPEPGATTLLNQPFVLGYGMGPQGVPFGFELGGRGVVPGVPYVGWDAAVGVDTHSIGVPGFAGSISNPMMHLGAQAIGRFPFDVGASSAWAGAHLGLSYRSILQVQGSLPTSLSYSRQRALGVALGLDGEVTVGDLSARLDLGVELARGSAWASDIQLSAGYALGDTLGLRATVQRVGRGLDIGGGADLQGRVEDRLWALRVGVERSF